MENLKFLTEILMSDAEYWIVAKKVTASEMLRTVRHADQIVFIAIPKEIKKGMKKEEITINDIEKLQGSYVDQNVFINTDYPPFQNYISFYEIYKGYPVKENIKQFMIDALALKSDELYAYKDLITVTSPSIL